MKTKTTKWVACKKKLPEAADPVLASWEATADADAVVGIAWVNKKGKWLDIEGPIRSPSHWMPLPEPATE
jgi:hypothetical protein